MSDEANKKNRLSNVYTNEAYKMVNVLDWLLYSTLHLYLVIGKKVNW